MNREPDKIPSLVLYFSMKEALQGAWSPNDALIWPDWLVVTITTRVGIGYCG